MWRQMTPEQAAELAAAMGSPMVFAADACCGYGRPLHKDETQEEAREDFESAGESCDRIEIVYP